MLLQQSKYSYWIFVLIGFLVVTSIYFYQRESVPKEHFQTTTTPDSTSIPQNLELQSTSTPAVMPMPMKTNLKLYLSAFVQPSTFQCQNNHWCDSTNPIVKYLLNTDALPTALQPSVGLNIHRVKINGPAAYTISSQPPQYTLGSFTVTLYGKINSIDFATDAREKVILEIPAQTPNRIIFFLSKVDPAVENAANKVNVNVSLGSVLSNSSTFTWTMEKSNLLGSNKLFAFTYDKETQKLGFYYGNVQAPLETVPSSLEITLGVRELTFNRNMNFDANLIGFTYYNTSLTVSDLNNLSTYFSQHSNGYALQVRAKEVMEQEMRSLLEKVQSGEDTIKELLNKINTTTCPSATASKDPQSASIPPKWLIKMGASADGVSTLELGKCSPLQVKSFGDVSKASAPTQSTSTTASTSTSTPSTATTASSSSTSTSSTTTSSLRKVPYPPSVTNGVVSQGVSGANIVSPASPNVATNSTQSTASSTSTTNSTSGGASNLSQSQNSTQDPEFWKQFFGFLQNQQGKNTTMNASSSNVNLNDTYDALRKEVSTDKTQPGNLLFQPTVQDPPKAPEPSATQPVVATKSWWDSVADVFLN